MKRLLALLLLVVVLAAGAWLEYVRHEQRSIISGFFENQPVEVSSRIQGRIARIYAAEGQTVKAGDVLIELEAVAAQRETEAAVAAAEQARQHYEEALRGPRPEDIRQQRAKVAELTAELTRLRNGSRPQEIEQAVAEERDARAHLAVLQRGLTPEERAQLRARVDAAVAEEYAAVRDAARYAQLYRQDEVSREQNERKQADARKATAQRRDAEKAYQRAMEGTPAEELEQGRQAWLSARANLDLALAGSRSEDIVAAKARLQAARAQLDELLAGTRQEQVRAARAAARSAMLTAVSSRVRLQERIVRAPINGTVDRVPVAVGDLIDPATTVVRLSDPTDVWIRIYIPELNLAEITPGTHAKLAVDGIRELLPAHVESVATHGEFTPANLQMPAERGKQVFAVRLRLDHPDTRIRAGMYATVRTLGRWEP